MTRNILSILILILIVMGTILQKELLQPSRGQAMAMPFILSGIISFYLILIYSCSYLLHRYTKRIYNIYIAIITQGLIIGYTVNRYILYEEVMNGNISKDEWNSDYFPPDELNYFIIIFFSILIFIFCIKQIKATKEM